MSPGPVGLVTVGSVFGEELWFQSGIRVISGTSLNPFWKLGTGRPSVGNGTWEV